MDVRSLLGSEGNHPHSFHAGSYSNNLNPVIRGCATKPGYPRKGKQPMTQTDMFGFTQEEIERRNQSMWPLFDALTELFYWSMQDHLLGTHQEKFSTNEPGEHRVASATQVKEA